MNSKIIVLGSTGFIGSALQKRLQKENAFLVEGYNSSTLNLVSPNCIDKLSKILDDTEILIIAARAHQNRDPLNTYMDDINTVTNIARCLSKISVGKCLYFSTAAIYGDEISNSSITEETVVAPNSFYGAAKFAGECVLRKVASDAGIPLTVLRPCMIYGPGNTSRAYGPGRLARSIIREGKVYIFGDGNEVRDYLYIDDLVEITTRFILKGQTGTLNLATGAAHSFQQILNYLRKFSKREFEIIQVERDRPKSELKIKPEKLFSALPGLHFMDFEEGLKETFNCFVKEHCKEK